MVQIVDNTEKKVPLTQKVRRGLAIVRTITLDALDYTKPSAERTFAKLNAKDKDDFFRALEWLAQNAKGGDS